MRPITANERAFRVLIRNALFRRVELAALRRWAALAELDAEPDWQTELAPYFAEYGEIGTGPDARAPLIPPGGM